MRCEEIMKKDVECVSPQDTVQAAAKRLRDENIGFLPVCDQSKKVQGTITDRDLAIRVLADARPATTQVKDVMTRESIACRPEDDLKKAEELMTKNHKSRIMCMDQNGRLVGVISLSDIALREEAGRAAQTMRGVSEREART
jgi:CBS domain-containing protein